MQDDTSLAPLLADLAAEHDALDALVAPLPAADWDRTTPAAGWLIRHQIAHLTYFDEQAAVAASDGDRFERERDATSASGAFDTAGPYVHLQADALLDRWRRGRGALLAAFDGVGARQRLPWYGPPMSARSFLTARLMETWAHGTDVADAVGASLPASDRLRHVAHLGVVTRGWSYAVRGREAPPGDVRVELDPPGGGPPWAWGPADATDRVTGPAVDFCLIVTQRRPARDTALVATPGPAAEWLAVAQAFAGGPTTTEPARTSGL
ncbi:MAG: TIGR03084 family metal-binding protein [Acidimicrobiales bacterium]